MFIVKERLNMILRFSLDEVKFHDDYGNEGNCLLKDEITQKSVAANFKSIDEKILTEEYDVEKCSELIKVCPEIFLILPKNVTSKEENIKRLYKESSQAIIKHLTKSNASLFHIAIAENFEESIRIQRDKYLMESAKIGVERKL